MAAELKKRDQQLTRERVTGKVIFPDGFHHEANARVMCLEPLAS